ncbi:MAG: Txe/YoeB family addiction module toxin [Propionibacteriaceae bacterium]|jgi:toxin YoeB|nr:Txe/YoeB family addiction module toxin [Propionibacteriaceae bacterium]
MKVAFTEEGWEDYIACSSDKRLLKRVHRLIADIQRGEGTGLGQPELLRGDLAGWRSRRIDGWNRLVYRVVGDTVQVAQCGGHYGDK